MDVFCGIPQEIWEEIFSVLNVLVLGMILAFFAAHYQTRKKREIKLEAAVLKVRVDSYERLLALFSQLYHTISPTLKEEEVIGELTPYLSYPDMNTDAFVCTNTEIAFDKFYKSISDAQQDENIYLDEETRDELRKSVALFTECKMFLDAFCDAEQATTNSKDSQGVQRKIDFAYLMTSIMMKSLYISTFLKLEEVIGKKLRSLNLLYGSHRLKHCNNVVSEFILRRLYGRMTNSRVQSFFFFTMPTRYKQMISIIIQWPELFFYIHVMDKYSPAEFFNMDEQKQNELIGDFAASFYVNVHR